MKRYRRTSRIASRVELGSSTIDGTGMFAREAIEEGEVVVIWGGIVFTGADIKERRAGEHSVAAIGEGLYLGAAWDEAESPDDFMNHSCDPNIWMQHEVTLSPEETLKPVKS